jgi:hypothetical protein
VLDFNFKVKRRFWRDGMRQSYLLAKCPDGELAASFLNVIFRQEAPVAGRGLVTVLKGSSAIPCTSEP